MGRRRFFRCASFSLASENRSFSTQIYQSFSTITQNVGTFVCRRGSRMGLAWLTSLPHHSVAWRMNLETFLEQLIQNEPKTIPELENWVGPLGLRSWWDVKHPISIPPAGSKRSFPFAGLEQVQIDCGLADQHIDIHHQDVSNLQALGIIRYCLQFRDSWEIARSVLTKRLGPGSVLSSGEAFGRFFLYPMQRDLFQLYWHQRGASELYADSGRISSPELDTTVQPESATNQQRNLMLMAFMVFGDHLGKESEQTAWTTFCKQIPKSAGVLSQTGSITWFGKPPQTTYHIRLEPGEDALSLCTHLGWKHPVAISTDVHQSRWQIKLSPTPLQHTGQAATIDHLISPMWKEQEVEVLLEGRPNADHMPLLTWKNSPVYDVRVYPSKVRSLGLYPPQD
jgi:hypothetical protein